MRQDVKQTSQPDRFVWSAAPRALLPAACAMSAWRELNIYHVKCFRLTNISDDRASDSQRSTVLTKLLTSYLVRMITH